MGDGSVKRTLRGVEPSRLISYRITNPDSTWENMKGDPHSGGMEAYADCRKILLSSQGGICAYCEIDIRDNDPLRCRVEHFHPKSDRAGSHNWSLDWNNLLGVCAGGSFRYAAAPHAAEPLSENLSCDAHKDRMVQTGRLPILCDNLILNPQIVPSFPVLFRLEKSTGRLFPAPLQKLEEFICVDGVSNLETIISNTIDMLNLNCDRLCRGRLAVIWAIERKKKEQRNKGHSAEIGLMNLARQYFHCRWPGFFTTIRLCLGSVGEVYLSEISFGG